MAEITFGVGYMNAGPQASPLYSRKMKTWIVANIPREMFDLVQYNFTRIFGDIMTNLEYGRHSPTLFSKGQSEETSSVVEFGVNKGAGTIDIMLYRPNENVDAETENYIKNQLKQRIESASIHIRPGGGKKTRGKTYKSKRLRKSRSTKQKKTRKH